jgi:hypothetical protein
MPGTHPSRVKPTSTAAPLHDTNAAPDSFSAPILTVREVALELRCSKAHVHNLISGKVRGLPPLPALLLGRRRLVRRVSLVEWMVANEHWF